MKHLNFNVNKAANGFTICTYNDDVPDFEIVEECYVATSIFDVGVVVRQLVTKHLEDNE